MPLNFDQQEKLKAWFDTRNLPLGPELENRITTYQNLILTWSGRINLVSKGDRSDIVEHHILDSLGPIELIPNTGRLIDIGTGAGFPGIPLAMIRPELHISLMESIHKKILFLRAAKSALELDNIEIIESRLEDYSPLGIFDIATMRALPRWETHVERIRGIVKPGGKIIYYQRRGVYVTIIV